MKRTRTIAVNDGDTKVCVTIKVDARYLTRGEVNRMASDAASGIMNVLANTRYLGGNLSDMVVT